MTFFDIRVAVDKLEEPDYKNWLKTLQKNSRVVVYSADGQRRLKLIESIIQGKIFLQDSSDGYFINGWNGVNGLKARILLPITNKDLEEIERSKLCVKINTYKFKNLPLEKLRLLDNYIRSLFQKNRNPHD